METYQKGGITIDYYGECIGKFDECITGFCESFRNTKTSYPQVFHDIYHSVETISTTDLTDCVLQGVRQKPEKPLGEDGGRCPDAKLPLWSYKSELLTPKPKAYHHLPCRRSPSSPRR